MARPSFLIRRDLRSLLLGPSYSEQNKEERERDRERQRQRETETERDREAIKTVEYITFYGSSATELVAEYRPLLA